MSDADIIELRPEINQALQLSTCKENIPFEKLSEKKRTVAVSKEVIVKYLLEQKDAGVSINNAGELLLESVKRGCTSSVLISAVSALSKNGNPPSHKTFFRWVADYQSYGLMGLAPKHQGSKRAEHDWQLPALQRLGSGNSNNPGNITKILQQEGFDVEYQPVRRFIKALPTNEGMYNRGRLGDLKYSNTKRYVRRHTDDINPGDCYQSDGNMMPIYLEHPNTGNKCRFEITPCLDIKSRYLVGYHLSESESAESTVRALSDAIVKEKHVPIDHQADNGPGFKNQRIQRFYMQLGIWEAHSRAHNPKDNGYIERWHQILKEEFLKQFDAYCGKDKSPEEIKLYLAKVKSGEEKLMSAEQFRQRLDQFIDWYNHQRKHGEIGDQPPVELWQSIKRNPPVDLQDAIYWDEKICTVGRECVRLFNREYGAAELIQYFREKVRVEYNMYDDNFVKVRDIDGRWLCDAELIKQAPYRSQSVIEDRKRFSLVQKQKRLQRKLDEVEARAGMSLTHEDSLQALESMELNTIDEKEKGSTLIDPSLYTEGQSNTHQSIKLDLFDDEEI